MLVLLERKSNFMLCGGRKEGRGIHDVMRESEAGKKVMRRVPALAVKKWCDLLSPQPGGL